MIYFQKAFQEAGSSVITYQGKQVYQCLKFEKAGHYTITIRSAVSSSKYTQALDFHIGHSCTVSVNDKPYPQPKGKFPQVIIPEEFLAAETKIEITLMEGGNFVICNASDPLGTGQLWRSLTLGAALILTELENGWYRVNCNDFEYDDDFDDFVFELRMEREHNVIDICEENSIIKG